MTTITKFEEFEISELTPSHAKDMASLWQHNYALQCEDSFLYPKVSDKFLLDTYKKYIEKSLGIVVEKDGLIYGFMLYDIFRFHSDNSAFFPLVCHAAKSEIKSKIYFAMYKELSSRLLKQKILNHYFCYLYSDSELKELSYNLGFGKYVVDLFRKPEKVDCDADSRFRVREADVRDKEILAVLIEKERQYYRESPLFLTKASEDLANAEEIIESSDCGVFIAEDDSTLFGFMAIYKKNEFDSFSLSKNYMEAFILPEYRGFGIGVALLNECSDWAASNGIEMMHVDFESANLYGNRFWTKYFSPFIISVKRVIAKDILE